MWEGFLNYSWKIFNEKTWYRFHIFASKSSFFQLFEASSNVLGTEYQMCWGFCIIIFNFAFPPWQMKLNAFSYVYSMFGYHLSWDICSDSCPFYYWAPFFLLISRSALHFQHESPLSDTCMEKLLFPQAMVSLFALNGFEELKFFILV